jgi:hypothetical protein
LISVFFLAILAGQYHHSVGLERKKAEKLVFLELDLSE